MPTQPLCRPCYALVLLATILPLSAHSQLGAEPPSDRVSISLSGPPSPLVVGTARFEARLERTGTGSESSSVAEVLFQLDGALQVQRRTAPFTASIHLGRLPQQHRVTVIAVSEDGLELARDELVLNRRTNSFELRFLRPNPRAEPRANNRDRASSRQTMVELDLNLPIMPRLERIDLFLGESLVKVFHHPPFTTAIALPNKDQTSYLRAVAVLEDGNTAEAIVFLNGTHMTENIEVQYVQLYISARNRKSQRPILDLQSNELSIHEDGLAQRVLRFERVSDLALNLSVLLDVSASMAPRLGFATQAVQSFFETTMRPSDRATLVTFNDRPDLRVPLTADTKELANGLHGTAAQRGTALYDSLVFALYQLAGVTGQRAALVFSDGADETSTLRYEDAIEYARRASIPIYAIRLEEDRKAKRARAELKELSTVTGGRAFFIHDPHELGAIFSTISEELRSRYLATYQSNQETSSPRFRRIELEINRKGVVASTLSGYYP